MNDEQLKAAMDRRSKDGDRRRTTTDEDERPYGHRAGERRQNPPALTRCKCGSWYCGPVRCRFEN